jgi:hypothetical protein
VQQGNEVNLNNKVNLSVLKRGLTTFGLLLVLSGQVVAAPLEWTKLTLINGWKRYTVNTRPATVAIDSNGMVHLRGAIHQPTGNSAFPFVLPVEFRPSANVYVGINLLNARAGRLVIQPDGVAFIQPAGAYVDAQGFSSLEGVTFSRK